MLRLLTLAIVFASPLTAQAQMARYCGGRVTAESTSIDRTATAVIYNVQLRNASSAPISLVLTYRGNLLDRPQSRSIQVPVTPGRQTFPVRLGQQPPGVSQTLMASQLIEGITIGGC
jgi:hypothetical protein